MEHVVMLPLMAQGHLKPFLALAKLIEARKGYTVTIVNTPLNIQNLRSSLPPNTTIRLAPLPFSSSAHGLPPNTENTDSLPTNLLIRLYQSSQSLQPSFHHLLSDISRREGRAPLCLISDVFFGWTVQLANDLGMFHAVFSTCGGYGTAAYYALWLHLPHLRTDSDEFSVPGFPETFRLRRSQISSYMRAADGIDPWSLFLPRQISLSLGSSGMICNTVEEMEVTGLKLLRKNTGLPVWSILSPSLYLNSSYGISSKPSICSEWLDSHPPASVLYVCFGSQNTISASQMMELAMGLEVSGAPFIWVVRPPIGFDITDSFRAEWLPEGFVERMKEKNQGVVVQKWAPQLEILSHKSTGAFLSHCGWNSVLESLSHGVPIIGWPLASEQFYNSKMLVEELGVCVEIARGVVDDVDRGEVARVIGMVMGKEGEGVEMKKKAEGVAQIIMVGTREDENSAGSSVKALDDFIAYALSQRK